MARRRATVGPGGRVVAYRRVSALMGRGGDDFHSPDLQLSAIRRMTAGLQEVAVIDDIDQTGRDFERSGIEQIRQLAEARQMDVLAVYNVSRLGRNVLESLQFLAWLAERGVTIMSAQEHVDTSTSTGKMMLTNMLSIAQLQSDQIGDSWSGLISKRAGEGKHHGHRLLGYVKVSGLHVPHPTYGPMMTEVFARYARDVPLWEAAGYVAAVTGKPQRPPHLKRRLRNPAYLGMVVEAGEVRPGLHEPLVDEATWERVQLRLAREQGLPPKLQHPSWPLVGLVFCPDGHALTRQPTRHEKEDEWVYRLVCGQYKHRVLGGCEGIGMPVLDRVLEKVLDETRTHIKLLRSDSEARAARLARRDVVRADAGSLRAQIVRLRSAQARITKEWGLDDMPDDAYRQSMHELRRAEAAAAVELARVGAATAYPTSTAAANAAEEMLDLWDEMEPAEQGKLLRTQVREIIVRRADYHREPEACRTQVFFW